MHEKWIEYGERPSDYMRIQLVDGPLFEVNITFSFLDSKEPQMLDDLELFRV